MELDEATKQRLKNITSEVMDHVYDEPVADGVLSRDVGEETSHQPQSESMENQKAGNNQSKLLSKYIDMDSVIPEESFRLSNEYTIDYARDSNKIPSFIESEPIFEDQHNEDQESEVGEPQ